MKRNEFFELIRGICIIAVVLIHCIASINYNEFNSLEFNYITILRQIINFPVAIFIFMSGYFLNISKLENNLNKYFKDRFKRLIIPFLIWSLFYSIVNIITHLKNINVFRIIVEFMTGQSSAPLYYILVLVQLLILSPLIVKAINSDKKTMNYLLIIITPLYLLFIYTYTIITKCQIPLYATIFMAWFIFYYLGIYLKIKGIDKIKSISISKSILFVLISLILSVVETYIINFNGLPYGFAMSQIKVSSFIYCLSIINLIVQIKKTRVIEEKIDKSNILNKVLLELGKYSYGIYFIHCFWIMIIVKLSNNYINTNLIIIYNVLQLILVILLSYFSIKLVKRISKFGIETKLLGF